MPKTTTPQRMMEEEGRQEDAKKKVKMRKQRVMRLQEKRWKDGSVEQTDTGPRVPALPAEGSLEAVLAGQGTCCADSCVG